MLLAPILLFLPPGLGQDCFALTLFQLLVPLLLKFLYSSRSRGSILLWTKTEHLALEVSTVQKVLEFASFILDL